MATPKGTLWEIESHTEAKHEILRRYLSAWFPILDKYKRLVYIDGFAGPGRYKGGEPGSPIIALDVAIHNKKPLVSEIVFWFIEENAGRIKHLNSELSNIKVPSNFILNVVEGRFEDNFSKIKKSVDLGLNKSIPTFAFLDPFGFVGLPYTILANLLKYRSTEVFITFMVDSMNRFIEEPGSQRHILEFFGTDEALEIIKKKGDRVKNLRALYQKQLNKIACFVRFFEMRNKSNRKIYYLFFATNNATGFKKMKESMWKVDESGNFRFSDSTDPNQEVLFDPGIEQIQILSTILLKQFSGQKNILEQDIEKYVEIETIFTEKHMKRALRKLEEENKIYVNNLKVNGKPRIRNKFPEDTIISFI